MCARARASSPSRCACACVCRRGAVCVCACLCAVARGVVRSDVAAVWDCSRDRRRPAARPRDGARRPSWPSPPRHRRVTATLPRDREMERASSFVAAVTATSPPCHCRVTARPRDGAPARRRPRSVAASCLRATERRGRAARGLRRHHKQKETVNEIGSDESRARARARERCAPICSVSHDCYCYCYLMKISQVPSGFDIDAILRLEVAKGATIATATRHDSTRVRVASYRRPCASSRRRTPIRRAASVACCVDPRHRAIPRRERRRLFFSPSGRATAVVRL